MQNMELVKITIFILAFVSCFYFAVKAIFHTHNMLNNVTGKYQNIFAPLIIFMPGQFNEKGNENRVKFYLSIIGVAISLSVFIIVKDSFSI